MRTILTILAIFLSSIMYAQLNHNATVLQKNFPDYYINIKEEALEKWGTNHEMVVYRINNQANAMVEVFILLEQKPDFDEDLMIMAIDKWNTGNPETYERVDWEMVAYEYKKQLRAKKSY